MKNVILGIIGLALIVFLFVNSKRDKMPEAEEMNNPGQEEVMENEMTTDIENTENINNSSGNSLASKLSANTWIWDKTVMNDDTTILPENSDAFSLTFTEDGQVSGTTDCNNFFGSYTLGKDNMITFGPLASTLMYCDGSQEAIFSKNVSDSNMVFFTEEGNLVLLLPYDSGSVIFRK